MRGTQHRYHIAVVIRGIIPACAGSTSLSVRVVSVRRDHPRMCGEHQNASRLSHGPLGSSPHVRGALRPSATIGLGCGIIPACAGSTLFCHRFFGRFRDHPRMCGEHLPESAICGHSRGSSPHVRGAHVRTLIVPACGGIIPACTGSTTTSSRTRTGRWDHPRMCGEHFDEWIDDMSATGSSPHVRGAPVVHGLLDGLGGIIPACAGSTLKVSGRLRFAWDYPRMCGEHIVANRNCGSVQGSSPHVRGARSRSVGG